VLTTMNPSQVMSGGAKDQAVDQGNAFGDVYRGLQTMGDFMGDKGPPPMVGVDGADSKNVMKFLLYRKSLEA